MADPGFNKIFFLIGICIYIQLDVVLLQIPAGEEWYFEMNTAGDLGVQMKYIGGTTLKIAVFYDAQSGSTKDFFGKQITSDLLTKAKKCKGISNIVFSPCSIKSDTPNEADMIHLCVAKALPGDQSAVQPFADFISCYSAANGKDNVVTCLHNINVDTNKVNQCVAKETETSICNVANDNFGRAIKAKGKQFQFSAITDFKKALCDVLSTGGSLRCPSVCG